MQTKAVIDHLALGRGGDGYRLANELIRARLGGPHSARCLLMSVDFAQVEELQATGRRAEAGSLLGEAAERLQSAGAELLVLCTTPCTWSPPTCRRPSTSR